MDDCLRTNYPYIFRMFNKGIELKVAQCFASIFENTIKTHLSENALCVEVMT